MTTENITSPRLGKLSDMNPIMIYDGIMEMIFQEEGKSSERVVKQRSMFAMLSEIYKKIGKLLKK